MDGGNLNPASSSVAKIARRWQELLLACRKSQNIIRNTFLLISIQKL